jgi:hypothetical protein
VACTISLKPPGFGPAMNPLRGSLLALVLARPECPVLSAFFSLLGGAKAAKVMAAPESYGKNIVSGKMTPGQTLKYLSFLLFPSVTLDI